MHGAEVATSCNWKRFHHSKLFFFVDFIKVLAGK